MLGAESSTHPFTDRRASAHASEGVSAAMASAS